MDIFNPMEYVLTNTAIIAFIQCIPYILVSNIFGYSKHISRLDILFCQIATLIKVSLAFVFGLQTLLLIDSSKIYQLKGLKPKNKSHANFYECCDLMKKVYLD